MLNLFKGNLTLYAVFHLPDETPTAAYAQCLEIRLSNNEGIKLGNGLFCKAAILCITSLFTFVLGISGIHLPR